MQDKSSSQKQLEQTLLEAGLISIGQIKLALKTQQECELEISKILVLYDWIKQETVDFFNSKWFELLEEAEKKPFLFYDYDVYYDRQTRFDYNFSPKIMNWNSKDTDV